MSEFNSRIEAQRQILQLVNRKKWEKEELFGLSNHAIDRWISVNRIDPESRLVGLVRSASSKLFFLANKSQEQVSEEYKAVSSEIVSIARNIGTETT
ncbi:MAG: hypothetical protein WCD49_05225 [Candidatus Acidiferrales bacterium]